MKKWLLIIGGLILLLIVTTGVMLFAASQLGNQPITGEQAGVELAELLDKTVAKDDSLRNGVLLVDAPLLGVEGAWAAGVADAAAGEAMTTDSPFLSASIGKLFTAATVLSLANEGVLSLDDSLTDWLDDDVVGGLPVLGGDEMLDTVTIRSLLSHRSTIPDYFVGETKDDAPDVLTLLVEEPDRTWTPEQLLAYTKEHYAPVENVEANFEYADTNYDLLGLVIEAATGQPFYEVVAERVLVPLGLDHTWYHVYTDPSRTGPPDSDAHGYADVFADDTNLAGVPALSLDGAGGGLATTVGDLDAFMRGLLDGEPVHIDEFGVEWTKDAITSGIDYGYGLWRIRPAGILFLLRGYPDLFGVSGSTGTFVYYVPEYNAVIAGAFNQTGYQDDHVRFLLKALDVLAKVEP